jgi:5-methylcytosine-specific restriction endonuclease McrA
VKIPKTKTRRKVIKELDALFAKYIKTRDKWTCQRCHTQYEPGDRGIQCSHYFSRRYYGTRFDLDNCEALCGGCHMLVESDKQGWYTDYKKKTLGEKKYEMLRIKAYSLTKLTKFDLELLYQEIEKEYKILLNN